MSAKRTLEHGFDRHLTRPRNITMIVFASAPTIRFSPGRNMMIETMIETMIEF